MNPRLACYALTILLPISSSLTFAGDWYSSVAYSYSKAELLPNASPIFQIDEDDEDSGWQLVFGYQYNRYFSLELGWADYGKHSAKLTPDFSRLSGTIIQSPRPNSPPPGITGGFGFASYVGYRSLPTDGYVFFDSPFPGPDFVVGAPPLLELQTETKGLRLAANAALPLGERFTISMQAGFMFSQYETTFISANTRIDFSTNPPSVIYVPVIYTQKSQDGELFGGLGVKYDINQKIGMKLFWERILDLGDNETLEQDMDVYSLALIYSF
jgi:hypothetical protein